jgi:predicted metal-dependent HD superfamily phosphohydrolase
MAINNTSQARLWTRWSELFGNYRTTPQWREESFGVVAKQYSEPSRHYHTLVHVDKMLQIVDEWYPQAPAWIQLAAFYHDIVYSATAQDNEERSADLAHRWLSTVVGSQEIVKIERAILVTKAHNTAEANTEDWPIIVGDLGGMACEIRQYRANTQRIRAEYSMFDDVAWGAGRHKFIEKFLSRRILPPEARFDELEAKIRENMADELSMLNVSFV